MSGPDKLSMPDIKRRVKAMSDALEALGVEIGGAEMAPDGTIRILAKGEMKADPYEAWKKARANG